MAQTTAKNASATPQYPSGYITAIATACTTSCLKGFRCGPRDGHHRVGVGRRAGGRGQRGIGLCRPSTDGAPTTTSSIFRACLVRVCGGGEKGEAAHCSAHHSPTTANAAGVTAKGTISSAASVAAYAPDVASAVLGSSVFQQ